MRLETDPLSFGISPAPDNAVVRVDGAGGNRLQSSKVVIDDDGDLFIDSPEADAMDAKLNVRTGIPEKVGRATRATTAYEASALPDIISGLTLWYKADSILDTNNGDPVNLVEDYGIAGQDIYSTGSGRPTYIAADPELNYMPALEFSSASSQYLDSNAFNFSEAFDTNQFCFYFVQRTDSASGDNTTIGTQLPNGERVNFHLGWHDGILYCDYANAGAGGRVMGAKPAGFDGAWHILKGVRESDGDFTLSMDGATVLSGTYTDDLDTNQVSVLHIGEHNHTIYSDMRIAEIIWFRSVPSTDDQDKVTNYLAQKYALTGTDDTPQSADLDQFLDNAGNVMGRTGPKAELFYPSLSLTGDLSPSSLSSNQNNYAPTGYDSATGVLRLTSSTAVNITGLAGGTGGRVLVLFNVGAQAITLSDESGSSDPENRFSNGFDVVLKGGNNAVLMWDGVSSRWRLASASSSGETVFNAGSSTDNAIARFDGAGGKTLQNSGVVIDDSDNVTGITSANIDGTTGNSLVVDTSVLVVDAANNRVGIGTASPASDLEVNVGNDTSQILWDVTLRNSGNDSVTGYGVGIKLKNSNDSGNEANKWAGIAGIAESTFSNDIGLSFYTNTTNSSPPTEKMRLDRDGKLGLGTTAPAAELEVVGTTKTDGLAVDTSVTAGGAIKDEDDMASDSATALATQQSIKAYVDARDDGWRKLSTQTASISATIDFTSLDTATYRDFKVIVSDVVPATDAVSFFVRFMVGGAVQSGGSDYTWVMTGYTSAGATSNQVDASDSEIEILDQSLGSAAGESSSFELELFNPASTANLKKCSWIGTIGNSTGLLISKNGAGRYNTAASAVDGIRFLFSSGNIESGTFTLYGRKN